MEADSILVAVLMAGVLALLVWFEVNSRRNDAQQKRLNLTRPEPGMHKETEIRPEKGRKAA